MAGELVSPFARVYAVRAAPSAPPLMRKNAGLAKPAGELLGAGRYEGGASRAFRSPGDAD
jgi:hypothetical protein